MAFNSLLNVMSPPIVRRISNEYREIVEVALAEMLRRRRSIWRGSIFDEESADR